MGKESNPLYTLIEVYFLRKLPTPLSQLVCVGHLRHIDSNHGLTQTFTDLGQNGRVLVMRDSLHDSLCALPGVARLKDSRTDEDAIAAQLHHQRRISRCRNATRGEVDNGETTLFGGLAQELIGSTQLAGIRAQLGLRVRRAEKDASCASNLLIDRAHMLNRLNNVARAGLTLGADHGSTLGNAAQGLTEVTATADERNFEIVLLDVVFVIGRSQHFGFVDVVNAEGLEDLQSTSAYVSTS